MPSRLLDASLVRKAVAKFLKATLLDIPTPLVAIVSDHLITSDFGKDHPVVAVGNAGEKRERVSFRTKGTSRGYQSSFKVNAYVFVLYQNTEAGWTEAMAADRLDKIKVTIANAIADNDDDEQREYRIAHADDFSEPAAVVIGGKQFLRERIPLLLTYNEGG